MHGTPTRARSAPWRLAFLALFAAYALQAKAQLPPIPLPSQARSLALAQQAFVVYPSVTINGARSEALVPFYVVGSTLYASLAGLAQLGIQLSSAECSAPAAANPSAPIAQGLPPDYFPLAQCSALQQHYTAGQQTLELRTSLDKLNLATTYLGQGPNAAPLIARSDFSTVLNYDASLSGASGTGSNSATSKGIYTQLRFGSPWGYLESSQVYTQMPNASSHQRLETYWRSTWPESGLSLTVGDTYTSQVGNYSGSRIGGIQLASSYTTRPWYQSLPQTLFAGSTEMPSTLDLYVNGLKQYSQNIAAGPYELTLPPGLQQAGMAQVVTRDVLGRQTTVNLPLFDTSGLLAAGLHEWSLEAGVLRLPTGGASQYDSKPLVSGTWRQGLTNQITLQAHGEAQTQYQQAAFAFRSAWHIPQQVGGQLALSRFQGQSGSEFNLYALQQNQQWSIAAGLDVSSAHFATLATTLTAQTGLPPPPPPPANPGFASRKQAYLQTGWQSPTLGNFSLGRVWLEQPGLVQDIWSANWSKNINASSSLSAGLSYNARDPQQRSVMLSYNTVLGSNLTANTYATQAPGSHSLGAQIQKNMQGLNSVGWNVGWQNNASNGSTNIYTAGAQTQTQYGDGNAQINSSQGVQAWQANWRGGFVLMGGHVFATREIDDSFALVSTNGIAHVPVRVQNSLAGYTNAQGVLLVPNLLAYQNNSVSIDSNALPANTRIENSRQTIVPNEKSGLKLRFAVETVHAWTLSLRDSQGQVLPAGTTVLNAAGRPLTVVGFDGRVYMESPEAPAAPQDAQYQALIAGAHGEIERCRFRVETKPLGDTANTPFVQDLGVVTCHTETKPSKTTQP